MLQKYSLDQLAPEMPSDWTPYQFLVLELKASSAQYFELRIFTPDGTRAVRLHPFQGVWIRAAVPLFHFKFPQQGGYDLASMGNKPRGTFFITFARNQGPLTDVTGLELAIPSPVGQPQVELRSVRLSVQDPGDALLEDGPVVDEFGQWIPDDFPSKIKSLSELEQQWEQESAALTSGDFGYSRFGGYRDTQVEATGFFRLEQVDGRWWFVDPEGHLFFSAGVDVVVPFMGTRSASRESVFAALPPAGLDKFVRHPGLPNEASFHTWNLLRRYGESWPERWVDHTLTRMDAWGLNTIANWSDVRLGQARRKPFTLLLGGWGIESGVMGLPDIYAEDYPEQVDRAAQQQCAAYRDEPWLLGYFVANEPAWPEREPLAAQMILDGPETATQRALREFLADDDTPQRRVEFIHKSFEKFLDLVLAAIRKHDPNHLTLGIRFGSNPPDAVVRMAKVFDVYSHNIYAYAPSQTFLDHLYRLTGRPIVIGEFHFGTPAAGLSAGLCQVLNQAERGTAYRYYVENSAAHPALIGTHWFQWWDQPNTGRMDGENYNIGLVDVTDRPYVELAAAMQATHRRLLAVHSGKTPPFDRLPAGRSEVIPYGTQK